MKKLLEFQDGVVRYYNLKEATGNKLLNNIEKGRFAESDVYVTHEEIEAERDSVLMVIVYTPSLYCC